tara:strand:- start:105 stop:242 length:138 start_codon:yes stop_codon:yes gene_type:complete
MKEFLIENPALCLIASLWIAGLLFALKEMINIPKMDEDDNDFLNK